MKKPLALLLPLTLMLVTSSVAFASDVDTTKVYNSGFLVLAFLGFCALIVVAQLVPAIILMVGSIRNMVTSTSKKKSQVRL